MFKKITSRLYGVAAQNLLKAISLVLKRRDRLSLRNLKYRAGTYFMGRFYTPNFDNMFSYPLIRKFECSEKNFRLNKFSFVWGNSLILRYLLLVELLDIYPNEMNACYPDFFREYTDMLDSFFGGGEGPYETEIVKFKENDIVIDAGANIGLFSVLAADRGATVYAFEPQESAQGILVKNAELNGVSSRIILVALGVSDKKSSMEFFMGEAEVDSSASIIARKNDDRNKITINCISLDEWVAQNNIPRVDFIKADIEGAERLMLKGAKETLKKFKPRLALCTYHLPDDPEVMKNLILEANPEYKIDQQAKKLYAW